ncbi:MAG: AlpA family phage regulatory protein [Burkholderiales bacterium]|nr:AlpA family phage regulatory protein [Burkholderiales bacterium]
MTTCFQKASAADPHFSSIPDLPPTGFVRQAHVLSLIPISRSTLWRQVSTGAFPAPVKLSQSITAWRVEEVRKWIAERCGEGL